MAPAPPRALLLDFDGVIVESGDLKTDAFRRLYADQPPDVVARIVRHHTYHGGISRRVKIAQYHREFLGIELDEPALDRLAQRFAEMVESAVIACAEVPGAQVLLETAEDRNVPAIVISGTPEQELNRIVAARGLGRYFAEVHGSPREKPAIIYDVLARLDIGAAEAVFVGDAMTDFEAARDTGVPFIGRTPRGAVCPFPEDTWVVEDMTGVTGGLFGAACP